MSERATAQPLVRAFLAIPLPPPILDRITAVQRQLRPELPEIRWTGRDNLHLTLRFFGAITEENLEQAGAIVVSVMSLFAPFSLQLTGIGAFPSTSRARVVWLGVKSSRLVALHRALKEPLNAAGFPPERQRFAPHITIGRSRGKPGHILSRQQPTLDDTMRVDRLILFESRLQPSGAKHIPRQTIRLADPASQT